MMKKGKYSLFIKPWQTEYLNIDDIFDVLIFLFCFKIKIRNSLFPLVRKRCFAEILFEISLEMQNPNPIPHKHFLRSKG